MEQAATPDHEPACCKVLLAEGVRGCMSTSSIRDSCSKDGRTQNQLQVGITVMVYSTARYMHQWSAFS